MFKIFNIKHDASISSEYPLQNNGYSPQGAVFSSSVSDLSQKTLETVKESRFLFDFDVDSIRSFIANTSSAVYLNLIHSTMALQSDEWSFVTYPLSASFNEGYGENFNQIGGVSWENRTSTIEWNQLGGDYIDDGVIMQLQEDRLIGEITDLLDYNYGCIVLASGSGVVKSSFYTRHSQSGYNSYIIAFKDDYSVSTGSAVLFNSGSFPIEPFNLRPHAYDNLVKQGSQFSVRFNLEHTYSRMKYAYTTTMNYLPNLQYCIVDNLKNYTLVDYNVLNKVPVDNGNIIRFSTENFNSGQYSIFIKWESGSNVWISKPINFFVYE